MSSDKVISIFRNNWIWILTTVIGFVVTWTILNADVKNLKEWKCKTEIKIESYDKYVIEQRMFNNLFKAYLKREGVLVE